MFLLLANDSLQERTLSMTLRLGGHRVRVVNDEFEVVNLVKSVPMKVCGIVVGDQGGCEKLVEKLELFSRNHIMTVIYLAAYAAEDISKKFKDGDELKLNLVDLSRDSLLGLIWCDKNCFEN